LFQDWPDRIFEHYGGIDGWEKSLLKLMDREQLQKTVQSELENHDLEDFKDYALLSE
jgi:hypothetical protein